MVQVLEVESLRMVRARQNLSRPAVLKSRFSRFPKTEDVREHHPQDHPDSDERYHQDGPYIRTAGQVPVVHYRQRKEESK